MYPKLFFHVVGTLRYECSRYQGFTVNKNICCGTFIALLAIADIYIYVDIYVYVCCHFSICSVCCILVRSHNITLLKEHSNQNLQYLVFYLHILGALLHCKNKLFQL